MISSSSDEDRPMPAGKGRKGKRPVTKSRLRKV
jgi:hypothetical protein